MLSTVHTQDAYRTINRSIGVFPHEAQTGVRNRLAELMVSNISGVEFIKDPNRTHEIKDFCERSHDILGTQSFDQHLVMLLRAGQITVEVAKDASSNPSDFERALAFD